jgi:hypothetical protein
MNIALKIWYLIIGEPNALKAVSGVNKAVARLEKAVNWQKLKAEAKAKAAKLAAEAEALARVEADKAERLAKKLEDFFELKIK